MIYDDALTIFNHQSLHYIIFLTKSRRGKMERSTRHCSQWNRCGKACAQAHRKYNLFLPMCHLMSCSCQLKIRPKSFASQLIQNIENSIVVTNIVIFCHRVCSLTFITWGSSSQSIWPRYSRKRRIDAKLIRAPHQFSLLVKTTFVFLYICEPY